MLRAATSVPAPEAARGASVACCPMMLPGKATAHAPTKAWVSILTGAVQICLLLTAVSVTILVVSPVTTLHSREGIV